MTPDTLAAGRDAFDRQQWEDAHRLLAAADDQHDLAAEDLERLAVAAHLTGRDQAATDLWERAHRAHRVAGRIPRAVRCVFWLATGLILRGEVARGSGWLGHAGRLLEDWPDDCAERGYLLLPVALQSLDGEAREAHALFEQVAAIGRRFDDPDLTSLGRLGLGQALIRLGRPDEGVALLDEAMVAIETDEVSPITAGLVYCAVILACQEMFDLRRAHEWTQALSGWCDGQQGLVPFRGQCLVHRSEIMQRGGAWQDAVDEARRARQRLSDPPGQPALGMACYQQAELRRLRGRFVQAEEAYREAGRHGHAPQPGLALLRLAQGDTDKAAASIQRALDEANDSVVRARLLGPYVEIMVAAGDLDAAAAGAEELASITEEIGVPPLLAMSAHATGLVRLAEGDTRGALDPLRTAWRSWDELGAPYDAARSRVLIGSACRELGDGDAAEIELGAARRTFEELGAAPDVAHVDGMEPASGGALPGGLTEREVEVLRLVATGLTNRGIAEELVISEHTVRRHLQNVFTKLDVGSRAAATAYGYEHDLI